MKPQSIGRVLGTGLRVAGRMAGQQIAGTGSSGAPKTGQTSSASSALTGRPVSDPQVAVSSMRIAQAQQSIRSSAQVASQATRGVAKGVAGFLRPFGRVGGTIWLEVTGVFFALPVVVFTPTLWRARQSWAHGPDHRTFLVASVIVLLFLYLSVTSFLRARRR